MNNLFRDSSYVFAANILNLLFTFISGAIIARVLGPEGKGDIYLIMQLATFGSILLSLGLGPAYQYFLRKSTYSRVEVLSHMVTQLVIVAILLVIILISKIDLVQFFFKDTVGGGLNFLALLYTGLSITALYLNFINMALTDGVMKSSIYNFINTGINIILLLVFLLILHWGVSGAVLSYAISISIRCFLITRNVWKEKITWPFLSWVKLTKPLLVYGISVMISQIMYSSVMRIDTFIVNAYRGPVELGIYSVAVAVGEFILMIPSAFVQALFPHLASASKKEQVAIISKVARITLIFGITGAFLMALLGFPIIRIAFGQKFDAAFIALLWLLPGIVAMTLNFAYANFFSGTGKPHYNAVLYGLGAVLNVVLNIFLLPGMGINGASLASSFTYLAVTVGFIVLIAKTENIPTKQLVIPDVLDFKLIVGRVRQLPLPIMKRL
jgi:O-antigen/teichoic acid export membrane protein